MLAHGKAVLGYVVFGPVALLLFAESVRVSAVLPGGHEIKTVTQTSWQRINLQVGCSDSTTVNQVFGLAEQLLLCTHTHSS